MSEAEFHRWANRFPDALMLVSTGGEVLACNHGAATAFGLAPRELIGQSLALFLAVPRAELTPTLRLWAASGQMVYGPAHFHDASGVRLQLEGARSDPPSEGQPGHLLVRVRRREEAAQRFLVLNQKIEQLSAEIRARQQSEEQMRQQREWFQVTLASIGDAVIATDANGCIRYLNAPAEAATGWRLEEAVGRPMTEVFQIFNEHTRAVVEDPVQRVLREGVVVGLANHTVLRARDGTERPIEDSAAPIRDSGGRVIGVVLVFHDVTELQRRNAELARARDEALEASRAKDDFLAALSHELRTPLNPVLLIASEGADNPEYDEEARRDFATIAKNALLEARLIDDLLDLTRITRGKMTLELESVDVHAALRDAVTTLETEIQGKRLTVTMDLAAPAAQVRADVGRLQQVFWNLLNNAVKFTAAGGCIQIVTTAGPGTICVQVRDNGIGMTAAELERAFRAFSQGDHAEGRHGHRFGGLGLGLAISRTLVELQGGRIWASSLGRDRGATFSVELPLENAVGIDGVDVRTTHVGSITLDDSESLQPRHLLLLVEDHEPTRTSVAQLLGRRGFNVLTAASERDALVAAQQQPLAAVVVSLGLSDADGYALMRTLRQRHGLSGVALANGTDEMDRTRAEAAGFVAHMKKPVKAQELEQALKKVRAPLRR